MMEKEVKITDTTLRDAHQSLWATRMRIEDILPIAETIDEVGYHSVEVWGGATFDVCLRFLGEDPWERLSKIKEKIKRTPLQMLLRGQNIVGYKNYPDDVLEAFIEKATERGIQIFRIFDALDDVRNLEHAIKFVKRCGAHAQGNICYTISPVHTIEHYIKCAKQQVEMGIDSLNVKDMAGILAPYTAYQLIKALKEELKIPVQLHCHSSSGMATAAYVKAVEAGADIIDCAVAPLALYTSQPSVETMMAILKEMEVAPSLNMKAIERIAEYFEGVAEKRALQRRKQSVIDTSVIIHQIPGGMASNLIVQLEQQNALHRLEEVLEEIPRVRKELGYPPLVTPTSQIVGIQAVFNVLVGERYKVVPEEVKNYVKGFYGRSPAPIDEAVKKKILKDEEPIECRPADLLPAGLPEARLNLAKEFVTKVEDYISYALFPQSTLNYLKWKKDPKLYPPPFQEEKREEMRPSIPVTEEMDRIMEFMEEEGLVEFEYEDECKRIKIKRGEAVSVNPANPSSIHTTRVMEEAPVNVKQIKSPLNGVFYRAPNPDSPPYVEVGSIVKKGQTLCLVEAMKLFNEIKTDMDGKVVRILVEDTQQVQAQQVLFWIEPIEVH